VYKIEKLDPYSHLRRIQA